MDSRNKIFFIVMAVVVVLAIGAYALFVPGINSEADKVMTECKNKAESLKKMADQANQPDLIKTERHVKLAKDYDERLGKQLQDLKDLLAAKQKLDLRFDKVPTGASEFDKWLETLRTALLAQAKEANLKLSVETDKLLFADRTDDSATAVNKHREYRLAHMAVTQQVLDILCKKWVKQNTADFAPEGPDKQTAVDLGALELEKLVVGTPRSSTEQLPWEIDAYKRAKGAAVAAGAAPSAKTAPSGVVELPYTTTSLDIQFVAPFAAVPHILKALESADRFLAVIRRLDFQRAGVPFVQPNDKGVETAGPNPAVNTYYLEGPVRVLVTLDLYEYDKSKEEAFKKVAQVK